ncbi:MAG: right-handed parallel beta-helix repeat-containing protein [Thermoguttaceae bacterium]|nr:right-handed parallel beta-helix repeat-containing protein [Thermoguttaceae bacterium]
MKRITCQILFILVAIFHSARAADIWVSPNGSDDAPGTENKPVRTLAQGIETLRRNRMKNPDVPSAIHILPGRYQMTETVLLNQTDSGTPEFPLLIEGVNPPKDSAAPESERVIFAGSQPIFGWKKSSFLGLSNVWETDLTGTSFDAQQGETPKKIKNLYWNDKRLIEARYPNFEPRYPYAGGYAFVPGRLIGKFEQSDTPETPTLLPLLPEDFHNWSNPAEGSVCFFDRFNYGNSIADISQVDAQTNTITVARPFSNAPRAADRFYLFGLREELDAPGEWYHDVEGKKLYLIPPEGAEFDDVTVVSAALDLIILRLDGTNHLRIRGLSFTGTDRQAIYGENCLDVRIEQSRFYEMGYFDEAAIEIDEAIRCGVIGCDLFQLGGYGISLGGGDAYTMTRNENLIENNYIHHTGRLNRHGFAISLGGCATRVRNNLCHDLPRGAIIYSGAFHLFENNIFRDLNTDVEDTGATYTDGNNWTGSRGSIIRHNHVKNSVGFAFSMGCWDFHRFAYGFYLDENCGGVDVYDNLIEECSQGALHLHNGRDNHIYNNIIVDCGSENGGHGFQLSLQGWEDVPGGTFYDRLPFMIDRYTRAIKQPGWAQMRGFIDPRTAVGRDDKTIMTGNWVERNIFYFPSYPDSIYTRHSNCNLTANAFDWNLIWNGTDRIKTDQDKGWEEWQTEGADPHGIVADPLFVDPASGDYRLSPSSPAWDIGFEPFTFDNIGLKEDSLRASWPVVEAEGLREHPEWLTVPRQPKVY